MWPNFLKTYKFCIIIFKNFRLLFLEINTRAFIYVYVCREGRRNGEEEVSLKKIILIFTKFIVLSSEIPSVC